MPSALFKADSATLAITAVKLDKLRPPSLLERQPQRLKKRPSGFAH
jgi:hypothetical protein